MKHKKVWYTCDYCGKESYNPFPCYDNEFHDKHVTDICSNGCLDEHMKAVRGRICFDDDLVKDLTYLTNIDKKDIESLVERYKVLYVTNWEKLRSRM